MSSENVFYSLGNKLKPPDHLTLEVMFGESHRLQNFPDLHLPTYILYRQNNKSIILLMNTYAPFAIGWLLHVHNYLLRPTSQSCYNNHSKLTVMLETNNVILIAKIIPALLAHNNYYNVLHGYCVSGWHFLSILHATTNRSYEQSTEDIICMHACFIIFCSV